MSSRASTSGRASRRLLVMLCIWSLPQSVDLLFVALVPAAGRAVFTSHLVSSLLHNTVVPLRHHFPAMPSSTEIVLRLRPRKFMARRPNQSRPGNIRTRIDMSSLPTLIGADDMWGVWAVTSIAAVLGIHLEKTPVGRSLSGAVCAMLVTALLTNIGLLPPGASSTHVAALQSFVVRLATPLLLLGADLTVIFAATGSMLRAFVFGSIGTCAGSFLGYTFMVSQMSGLGDNAWKVASALTAKNIGGGLNFMAVAGQLNIGADAVAVALTVDNILGLLYFPLVSYLGRDYAVPREASAEGCGGEQGVVTLEGMAGALCLAMVFAAISENAGQKYGIPSTLLSTGLAVSFATLLPRFAKPFVASGDQMGRLLLFLFFASVGITSGNLVNAFASPAALGLMGFGLILYATHLFVILIAGCLLHTPKEDTLLASNANIGNPATAAAMASSMGWTSKILPAILVGTLGNACGTLLGLVLGVNILSKI